MHRMWNGRFYPILSVHRLWETPYIYVFSINVRRPMNVCVSSFCISRAFFRVCCFFGGVNVRCSLSYCFMFEYCKSQCISIGAYNSNMIEMIGLNIKRFSAHSISTFFASFFHFSKKKMQREKHWLSTVWAHQHQFSIFSQYGFKFISLLFNVFNWDVIKRILQQ